MEHQKIWLNLILVMLAFITTMVTVSGRKALAQGRVTVPQNQRTEIVQAAGVSYPHPPQAIDEHA